MICEKIMSQQCWLFSQQCFDGAGSPACRPPRACAWHCTYRLACAPTFFAPGGGWGTGTGRRGNRGRSATSRRQRPRDGPPAPRGALLSHKATVSFEVLESDKRPVSAVADHTEVRDVARVEVREDRSIGLDLLCDPEHNLEERILAEQFQP